MKFNIDGAKVEIVKKELIANNTFVKTYKAINNDKTNYCWKQMPVNSTELKFYEKVDTKKCDTLLHPLVIQYEKKDYGCDMCHIIYEWMKDGDCINLVENEIVFTEEFLRILVNDVVQALLFLKKYGLTHNDVKPDNILFKKGKFILIDYGCVEEYDKCYYGYLGTPLYVSPEFHREHKIYENSDVWSLGITSINYNGFKTKNATAEFLNLLKKMLVIDHNKRISLEEILKHQWTTNEIKCKSSSKELTKEKKK